MSETAVDTARVTDLMRRLHRRQGRWQPPRCDCGRGKVRYRNEVQALAAAEAGSQELGVPFTVYKCPGSSSWHKATRGFTPESLRSRPRIMAWHLTLRGAMTPDDILAALDLPPWSDVRSIRRKIASIRTILEVFEALGLVAADDPHPPYVSVADREGLTRVMMTGLDEYVSSLGISWNARAS
jgi:hypothetical protein